MAAARTFSDENRARLRELHAAGRSCRQIADDLGFSPATISKYARDLGLVFDRAQTDLATRARSIDLLESRQLLAQKMLQIGHDQLDATERPFLAFNFGGKDNTYSEHRMPRPPVDAVRSMVTTAAIAFDKASKILDKANPGLEVAEGILDAAASAFEAAASRLRAEEADAGGDA